jgi:hydrogenase/urease accessory protein HupE
MFRTIAIACTLFTMISSVSAHEGHGNPEHQSGVMHYVVNPSHAIPVVLVCLVALMVVWFIRRVRRSDSEENE